MSFKSGSQICCMEVSSSAIIYLCRKLHGNSDLMLYGLVLAFWSHTHLPSSRTKFKKHIRSCTFSKICVLFLLKRRWSLQKSCNALVTLASSYVCNSCLISKVEVECEMFPFKSFFQPIKQDVFLFLIHSPLFQARNISSSELAAIKIVKLDPGRSSC